MLNLLLLLAVQFSAFAADDISVCKSSSDCIVDESACNSPLAMNKSFLKQHQERNERLRPLISCVKYDGPTKDKFKAFCKDKICTLELTARNVKPSSEHIACIKDADCVLASECCGGIAVNKRYSEYYWVHVKNCAVIDCASPVAKCIKSKCESVGN